MEEYMPAGKALIHHGHQAALSSPYIYTGDKSKSQIIGIYKEAVEFGLGQLGRAQRHNKDSLLNQFFDQAYGDEHSLNIVLLFDFLIQDYVYYH